MTGATTAPGRLARRVLLIGWDAADWRMIQPLVEQGLMPHTKRFIESGVMGNVASLTPMLSPILWTSVATGKHADKHGILGFAEPEGTTGRVRPVTSTSRRCRALWNILSERGLRAGAINWFASHPAEPIEGFVVTDRFPHAVAPPDEPWPDVRGSVHPPEWLEELGGLRVHPARTTPQQILPFVPLLHELDGSDEHLRQLRALLAQCATVHAAATHLMQRTEWDFLGVYYDTIDRLGHAFMEFHPPRRPEIDEQQFQRFRHVMTGCYRFHDMMLGRLMELAGDDATVIILSDHGFHSDDLRPSGSGRIRDGQPVAWHRPYGVLAMRGPHIKQDERVYGASLLDVAPTVLALLGLPVADDMDGRPLTQVLDEPLEPQRIATHELGERAEQAPDEADDPWVAQQVLEQLKALGYMDRDDADAVLLDRLRNLGHVYLSTGRPRLAIEQFRKALEREPDDKAARIATASALMQLGRLDESEALAREVLAAEGEGSQAHLYLGIISFRRGDDDAALQHLLEAERIDPGLPGLQVQIGQVYLRRERWDDASRAFERALELDADNAEAYDGLGIVARKLGQPARAAHLHMESIGRLHHRPQTHVNLGLALAELGRIAWAIRAFNVALEMSPDLRVAHLCLAELYTRGERDREKAESHRRKAEAIEQRLAKRRRRRAGEKG